MMGGSDSLDSGGGGGEGVGVFILGLGKWHGYYLRVFFLLVLLSFVFSCPLPLFK